MTLKHKIKLLWCRFIWWLRITKEAKEHYEVLEHYKGLFRLYIQKKSYYLDEHKKNPVSVDTIKLKAQVDLLVKILDIKQ